MTVLNTSCFAISNLRIAGSPAVNASASVSSAPSPTEADAINSNSGDGLGIQQPRSMTWGGDIVATAPSGRADDSAKCPAVTGSSSCGDRESRAVAVPLEIPTQRSGESRDPLGDGSVKVGPRREDAAGIASGPQDANSVAVHEERSAPALTGVSSLDSTAASSGAAAFSRTRVSVRNVSTFCTSVASRSLANSRSSNSSIQTVRVMSSQDTN